MEEKEIKTDKPVSEPEKPKETKSAAPEDIPFEITNPDDIQIDNNGQLGLFGGNEQEEEDN